MSHTGRSLTRLFHFMFPAALPEAECHKPILQTGRLSSVSGHAEGRARIARCSVWLPTLALPVLCPLSHVLYENFVGILLSPIP